MRQPLQPDGGRPGSLDDPAYARFAWRRFWRVLRWMTLAAAVLAVVAWWWIDRVYGPLDWVATLALLGGAFVSILMAGALMGLTFLSSGSGHDEQVRDFEQDR